MSLRSLFATPITAELREQTADLAQAIASGLGSDCPQDSIDALGAPKDAWSLFCAIDRKWGVWRRLALEDQSVQWRIHAAEIESLIRSGFVPDGWRNAV